MSIGICGNEFVLNLLSNGFKFTFEGTVSVSLEEADDGVVLSVSDTGTGIPEQELIPFFQLATPSRLRQQ
jgi:signal transduction histidine kinase